MRRFLAPVVLVALAGTARADDKPAGEQAPASQPAAPAAPAVKDKPRVLVERVAAVVNDVVVLDSEVAQRAASTGEEDPTKSRTSVRQVLDQLVDEELILGAAAEAKLEVSDDEVQKALDEVKRQNHLTDKQLETALSQQGYTIREYKRDLKKQILRLRAVNVLVRPRVQVSDEDVKSRYERLSGQSSTVTEVHIRHVLLALGEKPTSDEMETARRRAGEIVARVRAGEEFGDLAKSLSDDSTTKGSGGDLGWYKRGELPTEWEEILFAMSEGEVRGPIRGPRGLHVFQVLENKKETVRPFAEVKDQLKEQIFRDEMDKQTKVWLQELRKRAHIEIKI
ncbi:MAG TPA: peptidylprolyl isomerase [Haliangiales bacterium]|nr:peptidylprolyl isomerase [Haliangiales bacterium]